ncbi:ATP-dependent DNA helicase Rep [Betaproteobacteria bacterium]|nr:ATP-dependent DNA helicase Rep [Betaproteobacteria bacterium]GHU46538.1 ATP-dependent DNA helicase Rep [Betaproteobacteria bacterium]
MSLNPRQREAIHYLDGPLLVLAGAGSGKTRVITQKIAYLVQECGFEARGIAAITFTNKAAREMQARVGKLISSEAAQALQVSTFHSLGVRILREEAKALGYKPRFSIFDSADCMGVIADLAGSVDKGKLRHIQSILSNWKNALISSDAAGKLAGSETEKLAAQIFPSYEATLKAYQAVDFDDLILLPVMLFSKAPEIAEKWQNRFHYLLIDEYQDTNACQYQLLKLLTGIRQQFTAVGDDDQSIYGWRGADIANLKKLPEEFPRLKIVKLEQNYRSTLRILAAANRVIAHNEKLFEKKLWSELGHGEPVCVSVCHDNEREAESVVMRLQAHRLAHRGKWSDYAILYRSNHLARLFEQQLRDQRVPYAISGGQSFFDKAEIKDVLAYLRLFANPDDDPAFIRAAATPKRGIGANTLQALGAYAGMRHHALFAAASESGLTEHLSARQIEPLHTFCQFIERLRARAEHEPARKVLTELLEGIGYERFLYDHEEERAAQSKWANVCEFTQWLGNKGEEENKTLAELTQTIALINMLDKQEGDSAPDAVQLSTLHAAKGLEFPHVFLVGVEEGILPHRESVETGKVEEERRLMYVGITRARQSLFISWCERRKQNRDWVSPQPSRFIAELGKDDVRFLGGKSQEMPDKAARSARLDALKAMLAKPQS